jgi:hypothetical protein
MTMHTVIDNTKRIGSLGTIEVAGIKMGVSCARSILEKPEVSALVITAIFLAKAQKVINEFRASGDLTDRGESAFRKGFDRGLQSQMQNPDARIEIRSI